MVGEGRRGPVVPRPGGALSPDDAAGDGGGDPFARKRLDERASRRHRATPPQAGSVGGRDRPTPRRSAPSKTAPRVSAPRADPASSPPPAYAAAAAARDHDDGLGLLDERVLVLPADRSRVQERGICRARREGQAGGCQGGGREAREDGTTRQGFASHRVHGHHSLINPTRRPRTSTPSRPSHQRRLIARRPARPAPLRTDRLRARTGRRPGGRRRRTARSPTVRNTATSR